MGLTDHEIDAAMERGRAARINEPRARKARYDRKAGRIVVDLTNGCTFAFPPGLAEGLDTATDGQLAQVELLGAGYGLHWEDLDVDLSVPGLRAGLFGTRAFMARQAGRATSPAKAAAARSNGALGGRPRKAASDPKRHRASRSAAAFLRIPLQPIRPPTMHPQPQGLTKRTAPPKKPRRAGASRRAEILAAAKKLYLTEGFEHATIRKIAAAVGVTSGALYLYFPDKDAITRALAEETFGALLVRLEQARLGAGSPLERLRAGMQAYVDFGRAHPDEYRLTFLSKMLNEANPGRCAHRGDIEAADRSFNVLLGEATDLIASGVFREMDPVTAAEALWCCMHGATSVLLDHADHLTTEPDRLIETVIDMTLKGLCRS